MSESLSQSSPPAVTEAIDSFSDSIVALTQMYEAPLPTTTSAGIREQEKKSDAARSKLESLFREQQEEIEGLRRDRDRLDALDNTCRQIAIRSFGGPEGTEKDFRWQVDTFGPSSKRPSVREAIDSDLIAPLRSISSTPEK
jgi:hypothetical protein